MKYNRSEIMKAAWEMHRHTVESTRRWPAAVRAEKLATSFSTALKIAWANAKLQAQNPASAEDKLFALKMQDHWEPSDFELVRELEREISRKVA